jgi:hypothetical protein
VNWICVVQGKDRWRAVVSTVMDIVFHSMQGISELSRKHWLLKKNWCPTAD